uniref:Uncharacterized protein n=1 Tax=Arundo donax TaxID=35708 RepID=A0A0A9HIJ7_ARUDO
MTEHVRDVVCILTMHFTVFQISHVSFVVLMQLVNLKFPQPYILTKVFNPFLLLFINYLVEFVPKNAFCSRLLPYFAVILSCDLCFAFCELTLFLVDFIKFVSCHLGYGQSK